LGVCTGLSPLSDDVLLDALDGIVSEATRQHLQTCGDCSERLAHFQKLEQRMHSIMYRSGCPSADELADYAIGVATLNKQQTTEAHLQTCLLCQQEVQSLQTILTVDEVEIPLKQKTKSEPLWQQVKHKLHDLEEQLVTVLVPRPLMPQAALKGAGDRERILNYEHQSVTVMLRLEKVVDGLKINGTIIDNQSDGQWANGHAELMSAEQKRFVAVIDEDENFTFAQLPPGLFQLNIYAASSRILRLKDIDLTL
jgi:hypothetical protein